MPGGCSDLRGGGEGARLIWWVQILQLSPLKAWLDKILIYLYMHNAFYDYC